MTVPVSPPAPFRCSTEAGERGDLLLGTASHVRAWILIEQPGAWGIDALRSGAIPGDVADALHERSHATGVRVILLRGREPLDEGIRAFAACTRGRDRWLQHAVIPNAAALLDLDWPALADGRSFDLGPRYRGPLFLVCTNGRHDVCCAERGRPLFRAVRDAFPDATWECSHIGGDRFAANLVAFPHGLYYGRLDPGEGVRVAASYERGVINLESYRGRCAYPPSVQAAEFFLRWNEGIVGVDELVAHSRRRMGSRTEVELHQHRDRVFRVTVALREDGEPALLTCRAAVPTVPRRYELVSISAA